MVRFYVCSYNEIAISEQDSTAGGLKKKSSKRGDHIASLLCSHNFAVYLESFSVFSYSMIIKRCYSISRKHSNHVVLRSFVNKFISFNSITLDGKLFQSLNVFG